MPNLKREDSAKSIKIKLQQDLEHRILHGMTCEWHAAWLGLDPDKQQLIRRPTFAIKELKNQWGIWSPQKREIALSRQLVLNYPWDSIRDVLLHEMAHHVFGNPRLKNMVDKGRLEEQVDKLALFWFKRWAELNPGIRISERLWRNHGTKSHLAAREMQAWMDEEESEVI